MKVDARTAVIAVLVLLAALLLFRRRAHAASSASAIDVPPYYDDGGGVEFKEGVTLGLRPEMSRVLPTIDAVSRAIIKRNAIVTSGTDGLHKPGSLHYAGLAIDLRTRDLSEHQVQSYAAALKATLNANGHEYDVVVEYNPPHLHVEYDPR